MSVDLKHERIKLSHQSGLDFMSHHSDKWLQMACEAETAGRGVWQKFYERAAELKCLYEERVAMARREPTT